MKPDPSLAAADYCYLTTTGRVSGQPREIEIWFALHEGVLYMLAGSGERADWVRNLRLQPRVKLRLGPVTHEATARVVEDASEDALARRLLVEKYAPGYDGDLTQWGRESLPVALDFD